MRRLVVPLAIAAGALVSSLILAPRISHGEEARPASAFPLFESTVEVVHSSAGEVVLRLAAPPPLGSAARGSAPFTALVRVPDRGRIDAEITDVVLATPDGTPGSASSPAVDPTSFIEISEPAIMRDLRLVRVSFTPRPAGSAADGRTDAPQARSLTLTLRATAGAGTNERRPHNRPTSPTFRRLYERTVVNYEEDPARDRVRGRSPARPTGAQYLIIAHDPFIPELEPLIEWKEQKGYRVEVMGLSEIGHEIEENWDITPEFVLLVGDTETIPTRSHGFEDRHTDNCYAAIDGDDYLADVMLGRFHADTLEECRLMVAKTLAHERIWLHDDPAFPMSAALLVADDFDAGDVIYYDNTWFIHDLMDSLGFAPVDTLFRKNGVTFDEVFFVFDPEWLTNVGRLPIVFSGTCFTGWFHGDPTFAERWLRDGTIEAPEGGVAFFGTTTSGQGPEWSLKRGYVDEGFFGNALREGSTLGEAALAGKLNLHVQVGEIEEYEGWNLLGDPALPMWTTLPSTLSVAVDGIVEEGEATVDVEVSMHQVPAPHAFVACTDPTGVYVFSETDEEGRVTLVFPATAPCKFDVHVAAKNAVPRSRGAIVVGTGPFAHFDALTVDDADGGNGDGCVSPGEDVSLAVRILNLGTAEATGVTGTLRALDPSATVTDSVASFGNIAPDSTAWGESAFRVRVSDGWQGGYAIPLELALAYGDSARVSTLPPLPTVTGDLGVAAVTLDDAPPGGNGNGLLEPGEVAGLVVALACMADAPLEGIEGYVSTWDPYVTVMRSSVSFADAAPGSLVAHDSPPPLVSASPETPRGHTPTLALRIDAAAPTYAYAETLRIALEIEETPGRYPTGPDGHGYYAYDSTDTGLEQAPVFDWVDLVPPGPGAWLRNVSENDNDTRFWFPNFIINYYGTEANVSTLCSNGFISLSRPRVRSR